MTITEKLRIKYDLSAADVCEADMKTSDIKQIFIYGFYILETKFYNHLNIELCEFDDLVDIKRHLAKIILKRGYELKEDYNNENITIDEYYDNMQIQDLYVAWNDLEDQELRFMSYKLKEAIKNAVFDKLQSDISLDEVFDLEINKIMNIFIESVNHSEL